MARLQLRVPGEICANEACTSPGHVLLSPADDPQLKTVLAELEKESLSTGFTTAIRASIDYVLDGARTGRFDLLSDQVHPGERASVGAKLEYEAQRVFGWPKAKPLDIKIATVPVDLKSTVGANWSIPTEAHCQLCICTKIELRRNRHRSWLVRTHTSWLYRGKGNKDGKRGLAADALDNWSAPLYEWSALPVNPLSYLTEQQAEEVLAAKPGQQVRLLALFGYLPGTVIPRSVIETVCAGKSDPLRRVRNIKDKALQRGLVLLCGTWLEDRARAKLHGYDLGMGDWLAIPEAQVARPERPHDLWWPTGFGPTLSAGESDAG